MSSKTRCSLAGNRSGASDDKITQQDRMAEGCNGTGNSPNPLISRRAGALSGALHVTVAEHWSAARTTASSATSAPPMAIISAARELFPDPLCPSITSPRSPKATQVACACHWPGQRTLHRLSAEICCTQTGRPTTNRAPKGSDVKSTSVGRIFSAQITPPWASTICLEIAKPRPE